MAIVTALHKGTRSLRRHPTSVDAEFQVVTDDVGKRFFQLSTFGSEVRQSERKVSQTIQLDEAAASELLVALCDAFPSLRPDKS